MSTLPGQATRTQQPGKISHTHVWLISPRPQGSSRDKFDVFDPYRGDLWPHAKETMPTKKEISRAGPQCRGYASTWQVGILSREPRPTQHPDFYKDKDDIHRSQRRRSKKGARRSQHRGRCEHQRHRRTIDLAGHKHKRSFAEITIHRDKGVAIVRGSHHNSNVYAAEDRPKDPPAKMSK